MLGNYNPKTVTVIVGDLPVTGFAEDSFVEITHEDDDFSIYKGADGTISRSMIASDVLLCKISLQQTSASNDHFSALRRLDKSTGAAAFPVLIKDLSGSALHSGANCFFKKGSGKKYGKSVGTQEWEIYMTTVIEHSGGNFPIGI